jgi:L-ascorbate metabolism protein UlaG (beta-lactamase superfamily)
LTLRSELFSVFALKVWFAFPLKRVKSIKSIEKTAILTQKEMENMVKITWLGHSCFKIEAGGYSVVIDPFKPGYIPGFRPVEEQANDVLCSHLHADHGYTDAVKIVPSQGAVPFEIKGVLSAHDDEGGAKRGMNTIHIVTAEGLKIAHMGDLGDVLNDEQIEEIGIVDVILVPIGGHYTIDPVQAKEVAESLRARVIIPMHYRSERFGFDVIGPLEPFVNQFTNVIYYPQNFIELDRSVASQVAVLTY